MIDEIYSNIMNAVNGKKNPIIGIDGLGGAGKSTFANQLYAKFRENQYQFIVYMWMILLRRAKKDIIHHILSGSAIMRFNGIIYIF